MASPLVGTKLYVPQARHVVVPRPRLDERLSENPRLTLISGPAGFGKTTLLAAWARGAAAAGRRIAWVSLEESEQEPASFWTYVVTALDAAAPGVGLGVLPLLRAPQPQLKSILATLLNELAAVADGVDLVLDDYHLADNPQIATDVAFLLEHLPPQVHLVISTRADPALPLARLRARGELVEIRAADLRFTVDEITAYLNGVFDLDLDPAEIATLEGRTEGWIAALQLAALSLQGRADAAGFIAGFAGDDRYVVDYLVEEVLSRQPEAVRTFLLKTSILDRLTGSLCDAVTGGTDGKAVLESLERSNLFVIRLDDSRRWYRYHHLFAEVLRAHLAEERPDEIAHLHKSAAEWYGSTGEPVPAVRHALAAGDIEQAADLVERSAIELLRQRQEATVRSWLDDIPYDVVLRRPVLALGFIGALMSRGDFETVEDRLEDLERLLAAPPANVVVLDQAELARLPGAIETYRAALALVANDPAGTVAHADLAIAKAAPGDDLTVAAASALAGLASWGSGDLEAAHHGYSIAVKGLERAGNISDVLGCSITLGDLRITQGRLDDAARTYEDALRLAAAHEVDGPLRGTADMLVGLSQLAFERNDLAASAAYLERVDALGERLGLPQFPYRWRVARARLRLAEGDLSGAVALLDEAERVYVGDYSPNVQPIPAQRARVLLAQGHIDEALHWAQHLDPHDELAYVREYEHITLARILLHQQSTARTAYSLLERLRIAAEQGGRFGSLIEILTLQALAHEAPAPLEQALRLAEPEDYVRIFIGEGRPIAPLLEVLIRQHPSWTYPQRLRAALDPGHRPVDQGLPGQLSEREYDVLRLLATDLDGPEISRRLYISLNTFRTHTKNIYAKLGVNTRRTAVTRATELGLL
ncbi:LuxR C-terminal-related transcriptional regulator [Kribbella monticola]|uniref:LuxR C-terminal-related transcriptional regulator n=1 Tax=Kribbella monticola TaxID=2185285 RepID=UPI000DD3E38A|nr:LuxR C-terminal-related transcriptional regulator [Kribbella monticola]